jgi:predicted TIM-barrel fold metal-dependent hydrolase
MSIDSHQIVWKYNPVNHVWINDDMHAIQKDFLPAQLRPILEQNPIEGCVTVQVDQSDEENEFLDTCIIFRRQKNSALWVIMPKHFIIFSNGSSA